MRNVRASQATSERTRTCGRFESARNGLLAQRHRRAVSRVAVRSTIRTRGCNGSRRGRVSFPRVLRDTVEAFSGSGKVLGGARKHRGRTSEDATNGRRRGLSWEGHGLDRRAVLASGRTTREARYNVPVLSLGERSFGERGRGVWGRRENGASGRERSNRDMAVCTAVGTRY